MDKVLHFISHTHWDREWYMNFEQHRFRFVEFMDRLIEILESNSEFKFFHLDGQVILLKDYLEIKPYMYEKVKKYIEEGRIKIGPWYVLQDEFLTSGEANIRNLLYGIIEGKKYGPLSMIGYFPDSFGNISQAPQILNGFGIDKAVFGRGINPIGENNTVLEKNETNEYNSELIWESPDGSRVMGVLFANWYHNAMEISSNIQGAIKQINIAKDKAAVVAATPHLLMMNGCDHQPVQENLPEMLKKLHNEIPHYKLIHSNFEMYFDEIKKYKDSFKVVVGELTNQFTDGKLTLVNTASSRIYLKQLNHKAQNLLEKWVEPMGVMSYLAGDSYRTDFMWKAWQTLMENHPHDSICGCSIDEVHEEMVVRFKKSIAISEELIYRELNYIVSKIDTLMVGDCERAIVVFNPLIWDITESVTAYVDFEENGNLDVDYLRIEDINGNNVFADFKDMGRTFTYELPKDSFRKVNYVRRIEIKFSAEKVPGIGYSTYKLKVGKPNIEAGIVFGEDFAENEFIKLKINPDGSLRVINKSDNHIYDGLNIFEDSGDIGDEYNFVSPKDDKIINTKNNKAQISVLDKGYSSVTFKIIHSMKLPEKASKLESNRSMIDRDFVINSLITIYAKNNRIDVCTEFDNSTSDHRLRVLFPTYIESKCCYADGQFEVVKRDINPWKGWKNPSNCQRQQAFVEMCDGEQGLVIANKGLPEYEVLRDDKNTIALTLVRSVGELGDWGYFPTPGAQCLGYQRMEYSIIPYNGEKGREDAHRGAYQFNAIPLKVLSTSIHNGELKPNDALLKVKSSNIVLSAIKKSENSDGIIIRLYNSSNKDELVQIDLNNKFDKTFETNMNEERLRELEMVNGKVELKFPSKKILTIELSKEEGGKKK